MEKDRQSTKTMGLYLRLVVSGFWLVVVSIFWPDQFVAWLSLGFYFALAILSIFLVRFKGLTSTLSAGLIVMDTTIISLPVWGYGVQTSPFALLYLVPVVAYTLTRGPAWGLFGFILVSISYSTLLALDAYGLLPPPGLIEEPQSPFDNSIGPFRVGLVTLTAFAATFGFVASAKRRLEKLNARERELMLSEKRALEQSTKLRQQLEVTARLESVGRLAGGVAHDFNNLLTGILGFTRLIHDDLQPGSKAADDLDEIQRAAERASELTSQLLAFSRKQIVQAKVVDINRSLTKLERMLTRLLGDSIELELNTESERCYVKVDPTQLERVVINLATNARDAMPEGGTLSISAERCTVDQELAAKLGASKPAEYVVLRVRDTGEGIKPEMLENIFEPFFTTKDKASGSGLGLATVYGIVKQANGSIDVTSVLDEGTHFSVYLPATDERPVLTGAPPPPSSHHATESILLVEDEAIVRRMAERLLRREGYHVISSPSGEAAQELLSKDNLDFQLLLTDVVMPGISGPELAHHVRKLRPEVPVIFMSGYSEEMLNAQQSDTTLELSAFLEKPFQHEEMLSTVRLALEGFREEGRTLS